MAHIEIPARLAARPQYHGMPVPWIAIWAPDEPPQFGANDGKRTRDAFVLRLCALCGQKLEYRFAFIGSYRECYDTRTFNEPAMCIECALYAAAVCPYLVTEGYVARHQPRFKKSKLLNPEDAPPPRRRDDWHGLYVTRSYEVVPSRDMIGEPVAKAAKAIEIRSLEC